MNVSFISLQEQLDTSSSIGQAMFAIIGAMAQLERDIIGERVTAGLERARARGRRLGRPRARVDVETIRQLRADGHSLGAIARRVRCSRATLRRRLRETGASVEADVP
jgi:DNA invertase Pin-like site-specific DNA recombinase